MEQQPAGNLLATLHNQRKVAAVIALPVVLFMFLIYVQHAPTVSFTPRSEMWSQWRRPG